MILASQIRAEISEDVTMDLIAKDVTKWSKKNLGLFMTAANKGHSVRADDEGVVQIMIKYSDWAAPR